MTAITVIAVLTLAFAPISLFFLISAHSYSFFKILNVSILVLSAAVGLRFLTSGMTRLNQHQQRVAEIAAQEAALAGILGQVGWVQQVLVNRRTGHVVDGHLRVRDPGVVDQHVETAVRGERAHGEVLRRVGSGQVRCHHGDLDVMLRGQRLGLHLESDLVTSAQHQSRTGSREGPREIGSDAL
jgi:hypothetical protein